MPILVSISGALEMGQKLAHTVGVRFSLKNTDGTRRNATQAEVVKYTIRTYMEWFEQVNDEEAKVAARTTAGVLELT